MLFTLNKDRVYSNDLDKNISTPSHEFPCPHEVHEVHEGFGTEPPKYNIIAHDEFTHIEILCYGYSRDELSVCHDRDMLHIAGDIADNYDDDVSFTHNGFSLYNFKMGFKLSSTSCVQDVSLLNGILTVCIENLNPAEPAEYFEIG